MSEILSLIIAAALVNNLIFVQLLGVSTLATTTQRLQPAIEIASYSAAVLVLSATINQLLFWFVLAPLKLSVLKLISFTVVSATFSTLLAVLVGEKYPLSSRQQSVNFFLIGGNSAIVGVSLQNTALTPSIGNFLTSLASSIGAGFGFAAVLIGFAALRLRLTTADIPAPFAGNPILLISAGIVAMSFLGFAGLI